MLNIAEALEKFNHLTTALDQEIDVFLAPYQAVLPDARLGGNLFHTKRFSRRHPNLGKHQKPPLDNPRQKRYTSTAVHSPSIGQARTRKRGFRFPRQARTLWWHNGHSDAG